MTVERMLELSILAKLLDIHNGEDLRKCGYNVQKMEDRVTSLLDEFLNPYVIDSDSKE